MVRQAHPQIRRWRTCGIIRGFASATRREIDAFFREGGKAIIALTEREILDEEITRKLA